MKTFYENGMPSVRVQSSMFCQGQGKVGRDALGQPCRSALSCLQDSWANLYLDNSPRMLESLVMRKFLIVKHGNYNEAQL